MIKKEKLRKPEKEGPKGIFKSPWSLHIGIFQILLSIIPPNGIESSPNCDQQEKRGNELLENF